VALLIGALLDPDANVRQASVGSLFLLTHHAALDEKGWSDLSTSEGAAAVHQRWVGWWNAHSVDAEMHGLNDCAAPVNIGWLSGPVRLNVSVKPAGFKPLLYP
jgi:hypothetical protein